jgi:Tol biopolymer transport system component/DNA-binding winged helix-turn-helix (wHTH) protein
MNYPTRPLGGLRAINLAQEDDFQIGAISVRPSRREIQVGAHRENMEPRVLQCLIALRRSEGQVASRDDLIRLCWDGRVVGDDAVNSCVAKVRALARVGDNRAFDIETIPRVGYCLREADTPLDTASVSIAPWPDVKLVHSRAQRTRILGAVALGAAFVALLLVGAWLYWPQKEWHVESSRPFISSLDLLGHPAFSPDGTMIAYSAGTDYSSRKIYLRQVAGGDPVKLTSDGFDDASPSWSSDGRQLAYVALSKDAPCRIMVTAIPAGPAREAGRCRSQHFTSLSWRPASEEILYSDEAANSPDIVQIYALNIDSGAKRRVTKQTEMEDGEPRVSPDGKWLAYVRLFGLARMEIRLRSLQTGGESSLFESATLGSDAWTPDSRTILVSDVTDLGTDIWAIPVAGERPYQIYSTPAQVIRLAVSRDGLLALDTRRIRSNLAFASLTPRTTPDSFDVESGFTRSVAFARDGTLACVSNRSGESAVWITSPGGKPQEVVRAGEANLDRLVWSPDGAYLAMTWTRNDHITVRVITPSGRTVTSFPVGGVGYGLPTWTPDSKALLLFDDASLRTVRVEIGDPSKRSPVAGKGWLSVTLRKDGVYATRAEKPGLWQIDHGIRLVTAQYPRDDGDQLAFAGDKLLVADFSSGPAAARLFAQPLAGGPAVTIAYAPNLSPNTNFAVDPRSGRIVYVSDVERDFGVDILRLVER